MSNRILLVANDLVLDEQAPMSGGALRAWGLAEGLRSRGFDVICSIPEPGITHFSTVHWPQVPQAMKDVAWNWSNQDEVIERVAPDVVVYSSNLSHMALRQRPRQPLVMDLHGPIMLEDFYMQGRTSEVQFETWRRRMRMGDFFLTPGQKQKRFFWSWFLRAGIDLADGRILQVLPVSLSPKLPTRHPRPVADPVFVFGGGFFPWTDPSQTLETLVDSLERRGRGDLWAFTDCHKLAASQSRFSQISARLLASSRVRFPGLLPRGELLTTYAGADVAVDLMSWNPERELAFTTRTIEYLWCGLPVIYNDFAELAPLIRRYRAGWCIAPDDPRALESVLEEIFAHPERLAEYSANAQRLVGDHFTWDRTIEPLAQFCARPEKRAVRRRDVEVPDVVSSDARICSPELTTGRVFLERFIGQHDGLSSIEIKFATFQRTNHGRLEIAMRHVASGEVLGRRDVEFEHIEDNSWVPLELDRSLRNSAGRVFEIEIRGIAGNGGDSPAAWLCPESQFPLLTMHHDGELVEQGLCFRSYHIDDAVEPRELPDTPEPIDLRHGWEVAETHPVSVAAGPEGACEYFMTDWNRDGADDLVVVKHSHTDSGRVEVHVFCGRSRFQTPILQTATPLVAEPGRFRFSVSDWNRDGIPDLVAIEHHGTASGQTEIHVFCGRSKFQKPLLQMATSLPQSRQPGVFVAGDVNGDHRPEVVMLTPADGQLQAQILKRVDAAHGSPTELFRWVRRRALKRLKASRAGNLLREAKRRSGW